jgi:hypothetical protein
MRNLSLLLLLALFALPHSGAAENSGAGRSDVPKTLAALQLQTNGKFLTARRGIFLLAADLPPEQFDYIVNGVLANCQTALERQFFTRRPQHTVTVYIFKNQESYRDNLREFFNLDQPISPYGHYGHTHRYIVVNYQTGPGTLVHEVVHSLMAADFPDAPVWISEGIAALYEQCRIENDCLLGEQNWRLPELQTALTEQKTVPLTQLFRSSNKDFRLMNESLRYAESRYFCLYLQELGVLPEVYREFRAAVSTDTYGIKTVEKILGKPLATIEQEWQEWLRKQEW